MESEGKQKIVTKYEEILKSNGLYQEIKNIVETSPLELNGAGMTSKMVYVAIEFKDVEAPPLHLFAKVTMSNQSRKELFEAMKLSEKEVRFLTKYVPAVHKFCAMKGYPDLTNFYPKCYYGDTEEIILENLTINNRYIQLSKQERQGFEPVRLALSSLVKHHAASYAFMRESGGSEEFFKRFPNLDFEAFNENAVRVMVEPLVENGIATNIKLLEKSNVPNKDKAIHILKTHVGKAYSIMLNTINSVRENEPILTLNHGDYWNNNMLFSKDEQGHFNGHKVLDWQCVRYNSPALDIGNFMYTSVKPETRRSHLPELLSHYLETLKTTASNLGCPIEISYDQFFTLYRMKFKYGFWFAIWLAVEVGYAVINGVDSNEGDEEVSAEEWATKFDRLVQNWIADNPDKAANCAKDLDALMQEYSDLALE